MISFISVQYLEQKVSSLKEVGSILHVKGLGQKFNLGFREGKNKSTPAFSPGDG